MSRGPGRWSVIATVADNSYRRQRDNKLLALEEMKNIQVIDGADNCVYDIFAATDEEFALVFQTGQDIAFINEVYSRADTADLDRTFAMIWGRRLLKSDVIGIHGTLFYDLDHKSIYYPTRRDEEAINPDGSSLR